MSRNVFKCPYCSELTQHIYIPCGDAAMIRANKEHNNALKALGKCTGAFLNLTGLGRSLDSLGRRTYKCLICGTVSTFSPDGTFYGVDVWGPNDKE